MKEATMWITYFSVVIGIALCFGIGAMAIDPADSRREIALKSSCFRA
jgi:hypothetical protein